MAPFRIRRMRGRVAIGSRNSQSVPNDRARANDADDPLAAGHTASIMGRKCYPRTPAPGQRDLTIDQTALRLGVSRETLRQWRLSGVLRPRAVPGRGKRAMLRYPLKDIEAFERGRSVASR